MSHRAGFVSIVGKPNVGKSTLLNELVGEKLSIITSKAQTTRHRIMGIVNDEKYQIVYSDTPGILSPSYKMHESLMGFVESSLKDADLFLYIVEFGERERENEVIEKINKSGIPVILLINKIDRANAETLAEYQKEWEGIFENGEIFPISALYGFDLEGLNKKIVEKLPLSPPYFDKDELTDKSMRFFVSEIIREKILLNYQKEIPYAVEVAVDQYKEEEDIIRIFAYIFTEKESQKNIIIGNKGSSIKKVGIESRKDIEAFVEKKVFLELRVKVIPNWRNNPNVLRRFGYIEGK